MKLISIPFTPSIDISRISWLRRARALVAAHVWSDHFHHLGESRGAGDSEYVTWEDPAVQTAHANVEKHRRRAGDASEVIEAICQSAVLRAACERSVRLHFCAGRGTGEVTLLADGPKWQETPALTIRSELCFQGSPGFGQHIAEIEAARNALRAARA